MSDLKQALDTFNTVVGVLETVANTPGVSMIPYVGTAAGALRILQSAVNAGVNIAPYLLAIKNTFGGDVPTPEQLAALDAKIAELEAKVDAPLPPKEADEPE